MAAGGGGAWKVAYADFVTAMMAFFMVMWLVSQKEDAKEAIAHYFEDPFDDHAGHAAARAHAAKAGHGKKSHGKVGAGKPKSPTDDPHQPEAKKSRILALHGGNRSAFGAVIGFQDDSSELDATGKEQLELAMPKFVGIPHKIEIRGHVSNRSAASTDAWKLSYERSLSVMAYLVSHGIEQKRIRLAQAGAHEPLSITGSAEAMARNSRVAVFLLEEFAEDTVGNPEERSLLSQDDTELISAPAGDHGADAHKDAAAHQEADSHQDAASGKATDSHGDAASHKEVGAHKEKASHAPKKDGPRTINPHAITETRPPAKPKQAHADKAGHGHAEKPKSGHSDSHGAKKSAPKAKGGH